MFSLLSPGASPVLRECSQTFPTKLRRPEWGQDVSHSDPLLVVNSLGETGSRRRWVRILDATSSGAATSPEAGVLPARLCYRHCHRQCLPLAQEPGWSPVPAVTTQTASDKGPLSWGTNSSPFHPLHGAQQPLPHLHWTKQSIYWQLLSSQSVQKITPNKTKKQTDSAPALFPLNNTYPDSRTNHSQLPGTFQYYQGAKHTSWVFCTSGWNWGQQSSEFR